tara:strand:+ start:23144 stop:24310 length:1167 start_codon:yes stop_codon:yes gene_type:complete
MRLLIDRSLFGQNRYLLLDGKEYAWVDNSDVDHDLFLDINESNTLNEYLRLYDIDPIEFIDKKYKAMMNVVAAHSPNWKYVLPKSVYSKKLDILNTFLEDTYPIIDKDNYAKTLEAGNFILRQLEEFKPNKEVLGSKIENPTIKKIIQSFTPGSNGLTKKLTYDRFKTVTGRLVVQNGPQVLLLPRRMKNIFESSYSEGKILWVDFVSLEPRFAKLLTSDVAKKDIYTDIIKEYDLSYSREKVKAAVLSTLFGAGLSKLTEIVGKEAFVIKKAIDEYFNLKHILSMAGDYSKGKIKNYFGRPIPLKKLTSNVAVNNFIQSSSVDVSLMGFSSLMKDARMPNTVKPLCIIHDALVLDVKNSDIEQVYKIINEGIDIENVGHFFLECDII